MKDKKFPLTPEGYKKAKEYLRSVNKLSNLPKEVRESGFSVVYAANKEYRDNGSSKT